MRDVQRRISVVQRTSNDLDDAVILSQEVNRQQDLPVRVGSSSAASGSLCQAAVAAHPVKIWSESKEFCTRRALLFFTSVQCMRIRTHCNYNDFGVRSGKHCVK